MGANATPDASPAPPAGRRRRIRLAAEVLLALAILTVIVLLLLPAHADYTERSQASEAVMLLGEARVPLIEHYQNESRWPAALDERTGRQGKYTQSIAITRGAGAAEPAIELTATMKQENVRAAIAGRTIRMSSADGGLTWTCRPGTMDAKWLPSSCR